MHIAINALQVYAGQTGGGETYLRELLASLAQVDPENQYTVLIWQEAFEALDRYHSEQIRLQVVHPGLSRRVLRTVLRRFAPPHATGWLANISVDLMHWTNSLIALRPFSLSVPSVLTMMDIQHEFLPEFFSPRDLQLRRRLYPESLKRATRVIAISEHARNTIIDRYHVDPNSIRVIYPGINADRFSAPVSDDQKQGLRERYKLPERFILYPAGTWPHKNHLRLLDALYRSKQVHCILTGVKQSEHEHVLQRIHELNLDERVHHIGHVDWEEVPALYQMACGLIFPSLFEGFGFPVLEAMAARCPVAASNHETLVEISQNAIDYFDPRDTEAIADAIRRLWEGALSDAEKLNQAEKIAQSYKWRTAALETIETYQQTMTMKRQNPRRSIWR